MRCRLAALLLLAWPAQAEVVEVSYDEVAALTRGRVSFDLLPDLPEPGHNLDHGFAFPGGRIGERFTGQTLSRIDGPESPHDALSGAPDLPLTLHTGAPGQGLSVSFHRAFKSNALYPLGPIGYPVVQARGEGAAAVLFNENTCAFALRVHTEYIDALGTNMAHKGEVTLTFLSRDGAELGRFLRLPAGGITGYGFLAETPEIAGVTIENRDPGGIAIDDIRFGCIALTG